MTQNLHHVKDCRIFEEKEPVKTMSKGGYIRIYFGFCCVVVHFVGGGGWWCIYFGWWWMVVGGGRWWWAVA